MCGIIGYFGKKSAQNILLDGLKRMEYRGYDSAGIACQNDNSICLVKKSGKIKDLRQKLIKVLQKFLKMLFMVLVIQGGLLMDLQQIRMLILI